MSSQSNPQEYVVIRDGRQVNSIPFGYEVELRSDIETITDTNNDNETFIEVVGPSTTTQVPAHIISHSTEYRELDDGTILADVLLTIESESDNIELRLSQGPVS